MIVLALVMVFVLILCMLAAGLCKAAAKPTPKPDMDKLLFDTLDKILDDYQAKHGTCAEGRPTMPSEVEPELERERRTR